MKNVAQSLDKIHRSKLIDVRKSNQFYAHPKDLHEINGFNPRDYEREDLKRHIRALADAYTAGRYVEPVAVQVIDGRIYIRDGHCRRRAMLLAIEEGADLGPQPVIEFRGDEIEADALVLTSQSGMKLTPIEVAAMYSRMKNRGKTEDDIARIVGKTTQHVRMSLEMHTMPDAIKDLVSQEVVSATLALQTYQKHGTKAVEMLQDGVEEVLRSGKGRLTRKKLESANSRHQRPKATGRIPKKAARKMTNALQVIGSKVSTLTGDESKPVTVELTHEEVSLIHEALDAIPAEDHAPAQDQDNDAGNDGGPNKA
ncbi:MULTISPECIES: KorB domain-containing protein [unclassified Thioalkalivibrio]|uniref:ParB/RepB/Spo0J family partition protein n=1 Tax=unclassified Thioalkalivibrio TaxID=2621013 RepID=UPI0003704F97|nr:MULTISPECIES: KorB domain-containing protein [unclassified Thioalkalivibrio]